MERQLYIKDIYLNLRILDSDLTLIPYVRCIPYMLKEDDREGSLQLDVLGRLQVLMVSTPKRSDLIFPKVRQQNHI